MHAFIWDDSPISTDERSSSEDVQEILDHEGVDDVDEKAQTVASCRPRGPYFIIICIIPPHIIFGMLRIILCISRRCATA